MKLAITGGTGCLGFPLVKRLLEYGYKLKLLVPSKSAFCNYLDCNGIEVVVGDLASIDALNVLCNGCDCVFHLAAKVHCVPSTKMKKKSFLE